MLEAINDGGDAFDTRELVREELALRDLQLELPSQVLEQLRDPDGIDVAALEQIDSAVEPGVGRADVELAPDERLDGIRDIGRFQGDGSSSDGIADL